MKPCRVGAGVGREMSKVMERGSEERERGRAKTDVSDGRGNVDHNNSVAQSSDPGVRVAFELVKPAPRAVNVSRVDVFQEVHRSSKGEDRVLQCADVYRPLDLVW